jgi:hypothetical protein
VIGHLSACGRGADLATVNHKVLTLDAQDASFQLGVWWGIDKKQLKILFKSLFC